MTKENVPSTVFGGNVNIDDMKSLAAKAQEASQNDPRGGGAPAGSEYLNFSGKRGRYTIGKDERQIQEDEIWIVDVASFEEGFICWKGGKPAASRLANIYNGVPIQQPAPDELGPFDSNKGDGWFQAKSMVLKSMDNGQQGYFKINSVSGVSSMAELIGKFSERAGGGLPCWPVVCLDMEEFESQGFKNYKPIFDVQGWLTTEQMGTLDDDSDVDALMAENESGGAITDDTASEPEPAPKKPAGRRRSRR